MNQLKILDNLEREFLEVKKLSEQLDCESKKLIFPDSKILKMYISLNLWTWLAHELFCDKDINPFDFS